MPVAMISTSTSPSFGPSRSSSTISSGFFASNATAARVFISDLLLGSSSRFGRSLFPHHVVSFAFRKHQEQDQRRDRAHRHDDRDHQQLVIAKQCEQRARDQRTARRAEPADA